MSEIEFLTFTSEELLVEQNTINLQTVFRDIPRWSSLNALIYISRLREEYSVIISSRQLSESVTLNDIYQIILASK